MSTSPKRGSFDHVLGSRRGGRQDPKPRPLSLRDRARELLRWMGDSSYELRTDRIAYLHAERQAAAALGLLIDHCRSEYQEGVGQRPSGRIILVYDEDRTHRVAIIDMTDPRDGRLYLQDD